MSICLARSSLSAVVSVYWNAEVAPWRPQDSREGAKCERATVTSGSSGSSVHLADMFLSDSLRDSYWTQVLPAVQE